jgi:putative membrane protein
VTLDVVADRRLHPATFLTRTIRALPRYVVGLPAVVGLTSDTDLGILLLLALGGAAVAAAGAYLFWRRFGYGVGDREIVIESGILQRQRRVIPFDRIQDIDIEQGLLARLFGTAKVRIETGGGAKDEGTLDSVSLTEAHSLREKLRRGHAAAGARVQADQSDSAAVAEPLLFHMDFKRVLIAGLFNFSLVYLAVIFGSFEYLEALFGVDPLKLEWIEPARALAQTATWGLTVLALCMILLLGIVAGVLRTVARDYGFRLTRAGGGLRRRRGLLTLSEALIPFRRVQLSVIRSGLIARAFGWFRLEFQTLGADAAKAGNQVAAPFARLHEVRRVLAELSPEDLPPEEDYVRVSKRHILRQSVRWLFWLVIPILVASLARPAALGLLLLVPLAIGAAALQWRHHRYCLTAPHIYVRSGFLHRRLWILPYERIQALAIVQGPLQRRLKLASLAIDTAGASALRPLHIVNLPTGDARSLSARLLAAHREARARIRGPERLDRNGGTATMRPEVP